METSKQEYTQNNAPIHILNDKCLMEIFKYLPIFDRIRIERVCKQWRLLSQKCWSTKKILDVSDLGYPFFGMNKTVLRQVLIKCGKFLTRIDTVVVKYGESLEMIAYYCPNLTNINFSSMRNISSIDLHMITQKCKKITMLSLERAKCITDNDLISVFRRNQNLEYFQINSLDSKISGRCLSYLPVQTMRTLKISCCNTLELFTALARLENLEYFSIYTTYGICETIIKVINNHCKNLKFLQINGKITTDDLRDELQNHANLQVVNLCSMLPNNLLTRVALNCRQIVRINISGCTNVSDADLTTIATLPKLEGLYMNYLNYGQTMTGITDHGLKNMVNLKKFECRDNNFITDDGICRILASSPQLQHLDFSRCNKITNATYEAAVQMCDSRQMKLKMDIEGTRIVPKGAVSPFLEIIRHRENIVTERTKFSHLHFLLNVDNPSDYLEAVMLQYNYNKTNS